MDKPIYLIDSNVILDIFNQQDTEFYQWSVETLIKCASHGDIAINQIIYAEVATKFNDISELEKALTDFIKLSLPWEAGFLASKAFLLYKQNGGVRQTPLPDFYIGAHSLFARLTLVSRDSQRYRTYFPRIKLIAPD